MTEAETAGIIFVTLVLGMVVWSPICIKMWAFIRRYYLDISKIWAISLNGNNGLGSVKLVKPTADGIRAHKSAGGYEVPTELNFIFKDRVAGNGIVVYDEDTGMLLRPYAGEVEMGDPAVNRSREIGKAIDNMQRNGGFNVVAALMILGAVFIIGMIVLGLMINGVKG